MSAKRNQKVHRRVKASVLVDRQVRTLLAASPVWRQLPAEKQRSLARDMIRVGIYLVEPEGIAANALPGAMAILPAGGAASDFLDAVNFPQFVASLINGVFHAIVDASIRQMEAYGELVASVANTADQFARENITDETARDWLATVYPDYLVRDGESGQLRPVAGLDRAQALRQFRFLPLACPLRKLGPTEIEKVLVPAARHRLAASRQQLLATMVLMGMNR